MHTAGLLIATSTRERVCDLKAGTARRLGRDALEREWAPTAAPPDSMYWPPNVWRVGMPERWISTRSHVAMVSRRGDILRDKTLADLIEMGRARTPMPE